jgi:hypothetical protein
MYSIGMKKIGNTLPCRDAPLKPIQPRATTNTLCSTNTPRNNFVSSKTIQIGNVLIPIPCFLLPHIEEFKTLTVQVGYTKAVKLLASKYNVNIEPIRKNVARYIYPNIDIGVLPPVIQFHISIKMSETATITASDNLPTIPGWSLMMNDARYMSLCNDDTTSFSHTFTEMKLLAKYWVSKLPIFDEPFYFAIINSTNRPLNAHSGCLLLRNDRVIFIPLIFNALFLFYTAYTENTTINILYIGSLSILQAKIQAYYNNTQSSCEIKKKYSRWLKVNHLSHSSE